jgi:hypothetical protein
LTVLGTLAEIYIDNLRQETRKGKLQRARETAFGTEIFLMVTVKEYVLTVRNRTAKAIAPTLGKQIRVMASI